MCKLGKTKELGPQSNFARSKPIEKMRFDSPSRFPLTEP